MAASKKPKIQDTWPIETVDPRKVDLDAANPRIAGGKSPKQERLRELLCETEDIASLVRSIAENGIYQTDVIVVVDEGSQRIVVEGNRRVTACQILLDPTRKPKTAKFSVPTISPARRKELSTLNAVVAPSRSAAEILITQRHTSPGVRQWSPVAKLRRIAQRLDTGATVDAVADELAMKIADVRKSARDYRLLEFVIGLKHWTKEESLALRSPTLAVNPFLRFFTLKNALPPLKMKSGEKYTTTLRKDLYEEALVRLARGFLIEPVQLNTRIPSVDSAFKLAFAGHSELLALLESPNAAPVGDETEVQPPSTPATTASAELTGAHSSSSGEGATKQSDVPKHQPLDSGAPTDAVSAATPQASPASAATHPPATFKASPKADAFFESLVCHLSDNQLRTLTGEIRAISPDKFPACAAYLIRAIIERTFRFIIEKHNKQLDLYYDANKGSKSASKGKDPGLDAVLRYFARNFETFVTIPNAGKIIEQWLGAKSELDSMIHGHWTEPSAERAKSIARSIRPILSRLLDGSALTPFPAPKNVN